MTTHVDHPVLARLDAPGTPVVPLVLTYRAKAPWEVSARFGTGLSKDRDTAWVFARDLLAAGLHAPAGLGDVHLTLATATDVRLVLDNGTDPAVALLLPIGAVARFLTATARVVAFGDEPAHTDLDTITDALRRAA